MKISRREFLKTTTAAGVALVFSRVSVGMTGDGVNTGSQPPGWAGDPGEAKFRFDGLAKVTGQKINARDFRALDMEGWPARETYVFIVRSNFVDVQFMGVDLTILPGDLKPLKVITAEDLKRDGFGAATREFSEGRYLVPKGDAPDYLGQPVAILLFGDRRAMMHARSLLMANPYVVKRGRGVKVPETFAYAPQSNIIKVVENRPYPMSDKVVFSQMQGGPANPEGTGERNAEAKKYRQWIAQKLDSEADWKVYKRRYSTQMTDPMFMEPESGLAWYEPQKKTLHMVLGTQSPETDAVNSAEIFSAKGCKYGLNKIDFTSCQLGGGFGGRDSSIFCLYLAIAAAYADGPVRILFDRFEQFQSGLKRHPSEIDLAIATSPDGTFQAIRNCVAFNAGGRKNISIYLAEVAAISATSVYGFPLVDINTRALRSPSVVAGSVRGFGVPQAVFGVECMVDEIADSLKIDPIVLRRKNILQPNSAISTGAKVAPPGLDEMCQLAMKHPIWKRRRAFTETRAAGQSKLHGVGFAVTMKNYGTGSDPVFAGVSISREGLLTVTTHAVEMGTGIDTTLATSTAKLLGNNANKLVLGEIDVFNQLKLKESRGQDVTDPFWTPIVFSSTKAAMTSSRTVFGVEQSSKILFDLAVLPAAKLIWGSNAKTLGANDVLWKDGSLTAEGFRDLSLPELAAKIYDTDAITSVINHAFYRGGWAEADYTVSGKTFRYPIDALGVKQASAKTHTIIERKNLKSYTTEALWAREGQTMSAAAFLVAVEVDTATGKVQVTDGVHYIAPGRVLQRALVEGQMDGGYAEGLGYALLEHLPVNDTGPSNGFWNLGQYQVPLAEDCAIGRIEKVILPAESANSPARGIAEAVSCPIAPAIVNAVSNAVGFRFRDLPITPQKVLAALSDAEVVQ